MAIGNLVVNPNNNTGLYNQGGVVVPTNNDFNIPGNLTVGGTIYSNGNITTEGYFFGNGSLLTGIASSYGNANVASYLPTYTGNLGTANSSPVTAIFTDGYYYANGLPFIGGTNYSNANVETYLPTYTGNLSPGNIMPGNVYTNNYYYANGVPFVSSNYGNANVAAYLPTNNANVQAANFTTIGPANTGNIVGVQYVSSQFYLGDGGLLSNISANYGNSNVAAFLPTYTGNVAASYFIGNGSQLTGLPASYSNANVQSYLSSNANVVITTTGAITTTANVAANYFVGNGSLLTGIAIASTYGNANVAAFLPTYTGNVQAGNVNTVGTQGNISGANYVLANAFVGSGANLNLTTLNGHVIPGTNAAFTLGNITNRWNNVWVSGTVQAGFFTGDGGGLSNVGGGGSYGNADVIVLLADYGNNIISTTSSITAANFVGDGSQLTNLPPSPSNYGNANVAAYLPTDSTIIAIQGNVATLQGQVYGNANVAAYLPTYTGNLTPNIVTANVLSGEGSGISNITGANVTGTVASANVVTNAAQPNITSVGTLTTLATNELLVSGQFTSNSNAQFNGDVYFAGNVTLPGNINQISGNSGQFFGNAVTGFNALYAGLPAGYTLLQQEVTAFSTSFNGYTQVNVRNLNNGNQATGDYVITADNGTDTTNYVNLGFTGSGYDGALANNSLGNAVFATDGYLYAQGSGTVGGNLVLGSNTVNGVVRFIANGKSSLSEVVATVSATGISVNGNVSAGYVLGNGSQLTGVVALPVVGTIASAATITPASTDTQYNVTALAEAATFAAPSGTPVDGQKLVIRIVDDGSAQTLAWDTIYQTVGTTLPTTTTPGQYIYVGCIYNSQASKWNVVSVAQ